MRPRILHVIATLVRSGAEKQLALLASNLPAAGFETEVCALTSGGPYAEELQAAGIPVHVLNKRLKADPFAFARLIALLRSFRPDVLHTWMFTANTYGRLAAKFAGIKHIVVSERCVDVWKSGPMLWIDRQLASSTDYLVSNSHAVERYYQLQNVRPRAYRVIANAIPPRTGGMQSKAFCRQKLGLTGDRPVLGFIGRISRQKGLRDLLWATDLLRTAGMPVDVVLIGDGPERSTLERTVAQLRLSDIVHFAGHRNDATSLLPAYDLFVFPSQFEGMSNAVMEAMQAGIPVVTTNIPGMDEVVQHEQSGWLVPPREPFELARTIREALLDPVARQAVAERAKRQIQEQNQLAAMVQSYAEIYRQLLSNSLSADQIRRAAG